MKWLFFLVFLAGCQSRIETFPEWTLIGLSKDSAHNLLKADGFEVLDAVKDEWQRTHESGLNEKIRLHSGSDNVVFNNSSSYRLESSNDMSEIFDDLVEKRRSFCGEPNKDGPTGSAIRYYKWTCLHGKDTFKSSLSERNIVVATNGIRPK